MLRIVSRSWARASSSWRGDERAAQLGGEGRPVVADGPHVGVLGDGPEPGVVRLRVPVDRVLGPEPVELVVGHALAPGGGQEVDAVEAIRSRSRGLPFGSIAVTTPAEGGDRQVVGHRVGVDAAHHLQAEEQADERRPDLVRRRRPTRPRPRRRRPRRRGSGGPGDRGPPRCGRRSSRARARGRSSGRRRRRGRRRCATSPPCAPRGCVAVVSSAPITAATSSTQPSSRAKSRPSLPPKWS